MIRRLFPYALLAALVTVPMLATPAVPLGRPIITWDSTTVDVSHMDLR